MTAMVPSNVGFSLIIEDSLSSELLSIFSSQLFVVSLLEGVYSIFKKDKFSKDCVDNITVIDIENRINIMVPNKNMLLKF